MFANPNQLDANIFGLTKDDCASIPNVNVQGSLCKNKDWWFQNLHLNYHVINCLNFGLDIEKYAYTKILPCMLPNNKSALDNPLFVEDSISKLSKLGHIMEVETPPFCVNPLTVALNKPEKPRFCLDISRSVNLAMQKLNVKLDGLPILSQMLQENMWWFDFDIKR